MRFIGEGNIRRLLDVPVFLVKNPNCGAEHELTPELPDPRVRRLAQLERLGEGDVLTAD